MADVKYSIAIRKRNDKNDFFWNNTDFVFRECVIDDLGMYWYADPFIFEWNNLTYIFFEAFDLITKKGKIGYCVLNDDNSCSLPHIVIDEEYHLSFPNIFVENGVIYMMPECCGDNTVKLYKAVSFPDIWEVSNIILPDVFACDSVFLDTKENRYLVTNELYHNVPGGGSRGCYVKLCVYELNHFSAVDYGKRIKDGDDGIRNAGKVFTSYGKLYRVGQDCRNGEYGRGLVFFEIDNVDPYIEHEARRYDRDIFEMHLQRCDNSKLLGVHTYNYNDNYEIIDFYVRKVPSKVILFKRKALRYFNFIKRHI